MTPAKSVLTWLEYGLALTDDQHAARRKPYAVRAAQNGPHVDAWITVADIELLQRVAEHVATGRHSLNGAWAEARLLRAEFLPASELLAAAPPRQEIQVRTVSPVIFTSNGLDDPVLTKQRLFHSVRERWEAHESLPLPVFSSVENAEVLSVNGGSCPYFTFSQHRGWQGVLSLRLHGPAERLVAGNALLAYAELWGIGKGTTVGAGCIEVRSLAPETPAVFVRETHSHLLDNYTEVIAAWDAQFGLGNYHEIVIELGESNVRAAMNGGTGWSPYAQWPLSYIGLREEESRARRIAGQVFGDVHPYADGKRWRATPLRHWTYQDVWAYTALHNLPSLASYESQSRRYSRTSAVTWIHAHGGVRGMEYGRIHRLREQAPEYYARLIEKAPWLRT